MTNDLVVKALKNAYYSQSPDKNKQLIFHSDLGSQYTSNDLRELCKEFNIIQSFSKKGCPYDNACIESFHSLIKKEEIYRNTYRTFEEANMAIFKYIEGWYNRKRLHSSINYMTPDQCELLARSAAKKSLTFCVQNIDIRPLLILLMQFLLSSLSFISPLTIL